MKAVFDDWGKKKKKLKNLKRMAKNSMNEKQ